MKNSFKYLIVDNGEIEYPVVFSKLIIHKDMAKLLERNSNNIVVSAGFFEMKVTGIQITGIEVKFNCFGESESLKIKSRGIIDGEIIKQSYQQEFSA